MADLPDGYAILAYGFPSIPASVESFASRDFEQFPLRVLAGECHYWNCSYEKKGEVAQWRSETLCIPLELYNAIIRERLPT